MWENMILVNCRLVYRLILFKGTKLSLLSNNCQILMRLIGHLSQFEACC